LGDRADTGARDTAKAGGDTGHAGRARRGFPKLVGGRRGRSHHSAGADRCHTAGTDGAS
jgi:hypothetical protein